MAVSSLLAERLGTSMCGIRRLPRRFIRRLPLERPGSLALASVRMAIGWCTRYQLKYTRWIGPQTPPGQLARSLRAPTPGRASAGTDGFCQATGAQQIGRLTNLMQLSVDTSWYVRYRSTTNPDFGAT